MKTKSKDKTEEKTIIPELTFARAEFILVGLSPLIFNRLAEKARQQLLLPARRKNRAELESKTKHDVYDEFRRSIYLARTEDSPTHLVLPSRTFQQAFAGPAVDIPGVEKTKLLRWLSVEGTETPIFGIPKLYMAAVRQSDIAKTPDIRTRAIVPEWACRVVVRYPVNLIEGINIARLVIASGEIMGVGDFRAEKKGGPYGKYRIASADDPEFERIAQYGKEAQQQAMALADPYDYETAELLDWYNEEVEIRTRKPEITACIPKNNTRVSRNSKSVLAT